MHIRIHHIRICVCQPLSDERHQPGGGSGRLGQPCRERVGDGVEWGAAGILRSYHRCGLAEAVGPADVCGREIVNGPATSEHGFRGDLVCRADTRLDVMQIAVERRSWSAIDATETDSPKCLEPRKLGW